MRPTRFVIAVLLAAALSVITADGAFAAHAILKSGSGSIDKNYGVDLDTGVFNGCCANDDIWLNTLPGVPTAEIETSGAGLMLRMPSKPSYADCSHAALVSADYPATANRGRWFCARTDHGRFARFVVNSTTTKKHLDISFDTWK